MVRFSISGIDSLLPSAPRDCTLASLAALDRRASGEWPGVGASTNISRAIANMS
jgi:hypothetical protein